MKKLTLTLTLSLTHSEKSIQQVLVVWPYRRERKVHDPIDKVYTITLQMIVSIASDHKEKHTREKKDSAACERVSSRHLLSNRLSRSFCGTCLNHTNMQIKFNVMFSWLFAIAGSTVSTVRSCSLLGNQKIPVRPNSIGVRERGKLKVERLPRSFATISTPWPKTSAGVNTVFSVFVVKMFTVRVSSSTERKAHASYPCQRTSGWHQMHNLALAVREGDITQSRAKSPCALQEFEVLDWLWRTEPTWLRTPSHWNVTDFWHRQSLRNEIWQPGLHLYDCVLSRRVLLLKFGRTNQQIHRTMPWRWKETWQNRSDVRSSWFNTLYTELQKNPAPTLQFWQSRRLIFPLKIRAHIDTTTRDSSAQQIFFKKNLSRSLHMTAPVPSLRNSRRSWAMFENASSHSRGKSTTKELTRDDARSQDVTFTTFCIKEDQWCSWTSIQHNGPDWGFVDSVCTQWLTNMV